MISDARWRERFGDYKKAVRRMQDALKKESFSELEKDGVIQRFEFTFELAWKTLKDYLEDQSFIDISSPKKAIRKAFESGTIADGNIWIEMQEDRNRMSHIYNQSESEKIFKNIKDKYMKALNDLVIALEKELQ
jgi:nucleotidyltransferase substrate binding protein (TIGR01987 family)